MSSPVSSTPAQDPPTPPLPQHQGSAHQYTASNANPGYPGGGGPNFPFPGIPQFGPSMPMYSPQPMMAQPLPGAFVSPTTAVLCILVVGGLYWAFKNIDSLGSLPILGGLVGVSPVVAEEVSKEEKSSKSSSKETAAAAATMPMLPPISPYAFVSLFCFALLAAVLIQGPLGMGDAFAGKQPLQNDGPASAVKGMADANALLGLLPKILNVGPQGVGASNPPASTTPASAPQMGGRGQTGPGGTSQWDWFVNPMPPWNAQPQQGAAGLGVPAMTVATTAPSGLSQAQSFAFLNLPALLQSVPFCRSSPEVCTTLLANVDLPELARILAPMLGGQVDVNSIIALLGRQTTAQPHAIPLVPAKGFLGSVQGVQNIENAFYPLLIGAIGLVILFDYGT